MNVSSGRLNLLWQEWPRKKCHAGCQHDSSVIYSQMNRNRSKSNKPKLCLLCHTYRIQLTLDFMYVLIRGFSLSAVVTTSRSQVSLTPKESFWKYKPPLRSVIIQAWCLLKHVGSECHCRTYYIRKQTTCRVMCSQVHNQVVQKATVQQHMVIGASSSIQWRGCTEIFKSFLKTFHRDKLFP